MKNTQHFRKMENTKYIDSEKIQNTDFELDDNGDIIYRLTFEENEYENALNVCAVENTKY